MTRRKEHPSVYEKAYPIELSWRARIWTLRVGDTLTREGELYEVVKVHRSPVPGELPSIEIQKKENV